MQKSESPISYNMDPRMFTNAPKNPSDPRSDTPDSSSQPNQPSVTESRPLSLYYTTEAYSHNIIINPNNIYNNESHTPNLQQAPIEDIENKYKKEKRRGKKRGVLSELKSAKTRRAERQQVLDEIFAITEREFSKLHPEKLSKYNQKRFEILYTNKRRNKNDNDELEKLKSELKISSKHIKVEVDENVERHDNEDNDTYEKRKRKVINFKKAQAQHDAEWRKLIELDDALTPKEKEELFFLKALKSARTRLSNTKSAILRELKSKLIQPTIQPGNQQQSTPEVSDNEEWRNYSNFTPSEESSSEHHTEPEQPQDIKNPFLLDTKVIPPPNKRAKTEHKDSKNTKTGEIPIFEFEPTKNYQIAPSHVQPRQYTPEELISLLANNMVG
jgi:septum formation topological specificity factor MinE